MKEQIKQVGELLKSWVDGCLIQNCFVGHRKVTLLQNLLKPKENQDEKQLPLQGEVKNGRLETATSKKEPVSLLNDGFAK